MIADKIEEKNALIEGVRIYVEDHGLLTAFLDLDYGGSHQAFGGYCLFNPNYPDDNYMTGRFIWRCMEVGGVSNWNHLVGKTVRARAGWTKVHAIGHIIKDDWYDPSEDLKQKLEKAVASD